MQTRSNKRQLICGICHDTIILRGNINSCKHNYCFQCIKTWSERENSCPFCKKRFTKIKKEVMRVKYDKLGQKQQTVDVQNKNQNQTRQLRIIPMIEDGSDLRITLRFFVEFDSLFETLFGLHNQ